MNQIKGTSSQNAPSPTRLSPWLPPKWGIRNVNWGFYPDLCLLIIIPRHTKYAEGYIVFPFVHSSFHYISGIISKFYIKVSESFHVWVMGTLEGQLWFHKFRPQGSWWGWRSTLDSLTKCYTASSFRTNLFQRHKDNHPYDFDFSVMRWRSEWPIFHSPVISPNILKTIWWMNVIPGIINQCDTKISLIEYMWVSDQYFAVQWFCHISLKTIWLMNVILGIMD